MSSRYELSQAVIKRLKDQRLNADDVIRKALGINNEGFTSDGVFFPNGTVFMKRLPYKGKMCGAFVKDGELIVEGESVTSFSAAAAHYTGIATTGGWGWFEVRFPDQDKWVPLSTFKPRGASN